MDATRVSTTPLTPPTSASTAARSAVVVGGGRAGIAAAVKRAERGVRVTLVETRKRLGGRATSFNDPDTGELLDNCQHVLLGCCTNLLDLYERLSVGGSVDWHRTLYFRDAAGHLDTLSPSDLPAPLHLSAALLGFRSLSLADKLAIGRGMLAIMRIGRAGRARLGDESFEHWLGRHGQTRSAIDRFWGVIVISACNESLDRVAARYALQVFQDGMLNHAASSRMGLSAVPLEKLYDPAVAAVERAGGRVLLSTSADGFTFDATTRRITGLRIDTGETLTADAFVTTVPPDRLAKLAPADAVAADARLRRLHEVRFSPIIGIHLWYAAPPGRALMPLPHLILMDSPLQWVFRKTPDAAGGAAEEHLHGVISAAHEWVSTPAADIAAMADAEVRKALQWTDPAPLLRHRVVKEKRATFSVAPGVDALRPPARGAIANLLIAGDWSDTGWPATMEGAVRSGYTAAAATLGEPGEGLVPDLDDAPLYRALSPS